MSETYQRVARLMLDDGQIWFLFNWSDKYRLGEGIADQAWGLLGRAVMASQRSLDPGPGREHRPQLVRFNRDRVVWIIAQQE